MGPQLGSVFPLEMSGEAIRGRYQGGGDRVGRIVLSPYDRGTPSLRFSFTKLAVYRAGILFPRLQPAVLAKPCAC